MSVETDLRKLEDFKQRLKRGDWRSFALLSREDQRELVAIAGRFADACHAQDVVHAHRERDAARSHRRELSDHAQALQLRLDLLERAGDMLAARTIDD